MADMKTDSPLFDRIRVKPDKDRHLRARLPGCEWPGCNAAATHRAPKGRMRENEHWRFCLCHVREYNHSYNFFAGMTDDAIARYQKEAVTGHRPTWKMGMNGGRPASRSYSARFQPDGGADDPFEMLREFGGRANAQASGEHLRRRETRVIRNAERKAFEVLGLEADASAHDIKLRFKLLVKRHHPDANGGDRSTEDRLREIIQAYNYLKSVGFR
jgi:DnaJ-like protein